MIITFFCLIWIVLCSERASLPMSMILFHGLLTTVHAITFHLSSMQHCLWTHCRKTWSPCQGIKGTAQLSKYQFLKRVNIPTSQNMSEEVMEEKLVWWNYPLPRHSYILYHRNFQVNGENMGRGNQCG